MTPVIQFIGDTVKDVALACVPIATAYIAKSFGVAKNAQANAVISTAITRGVGLALQYAETQGDKYLSKVETQDGAIKVAVNYVQDAVSKNLAYLSVGEEMLVKKIVAEITLKLHAPPTAINTTVNNSAQGSLPLPPAAAK